MRISFVDARVSAPHPLVGPMLAASVLAATALWWVPRTLGTAAGDQGASVVAAQPAAPLGQIWVGTQKTAETLSAVDAGLAQTFLGGSTSFALGGWGSASVPSQAWASEAQFADDLVSGRIPSDVRLVMYDPERWSATPRKERCDPKAAMHAFATLAHRHGYLVMITPHPNLTSVSRAACAAQPDESEGHSFIRCGLEAAAAREADIVEVQAQSLETDVAAYRRLVAAASAQARSANPGVLVVSGLSTSFTNDPSVLFRAWRSVLGIVDGHYLNVPHGVRPEVAVEFLRMAAAHATERLASRLELASPRPMKI
jgi:hypothetical protein